MSAIWKGTQGPVVVHDEAFFQAETLTYWRRKIYEGSAAAISGLELAFQDAGISYDISNDGPIYRLQTNIPQINPDTEAIDRYEISTESTELSIFELPGVMEEEATFDATIPTLDDKTTYRERAEIYATMRNVDLQPGSTNAYPLWYSVVKHLKAGVPTFPVDWLVLRRFRKVDISYGTSGIGRFNLDATRLIYTNNELGLPSEIAFVIPDAPIFSTEFDTQFYWGWRKRAQSVELIGQWIEQRVELVLGRHSKLANSLAGANLIW